MTSIWKKHTVERAHQHRGGARTFVSTGTLRFVTIVIQRGLAMVFFKILRLTELTHGGFRVTS